MKKEILSILIVLSLFVVTFGCTEKNPTDKPYIISIAPDKTFATGGDTVKIAVSVKNPTQLNYEGNVLIQADAPACFGMTYVNTDGQNVQGYITPISVLAGETNSALISMRIPYTNQKSCYEPTTNHKLTIFILQKGQTNELGHKTLDFSLFEKT